MAQPLDTATETDIMILTPTDMVQRQLVRVRSAVPPPTARQALLVLHRAGQQQVMLPTLVVEQEALTDYDIRANIAKSLLHSAQTLLPGTVLDQRLVVSTTASSDCRVEKPMLMKGATLDGMRYSCSNSDSDKKQSSDCASNQKWHKRWASIVLRNTITPKKM